MSASITRRALLASAAPALALGGCTLAGRNAAPAIIHRYHAPRPLTDTDHAVVYRREDEFCAWTYTRGFWEDAQGHLMQNFDSLTVDYGQLDAEGITHNNIFARSTARRMITVRSTDRGLTWNGDDPEVDLIARSSAVAGAHPPRRGRHRQRPGVRGRVAPRLLPDLDAVFAH
jgi:hypothetical protein